MFSIRELTNNDFDSWNELYRQYDDVSQSARDELWSWLQNSNHETQSIVAVDEENQLIGFLTYRSFSIPITSDIGGFIDDLFVTPKERRKGIGQALIKALVTIGKSKNWGGLRLVTDEKNEEARKLYDKCAKQTSWVTYDIKI